MQQISYKPQPGDVVVTDFSIYQHYSIVSDKVDPKTNLPFLISATKRNGTVQEEPWEVVTEGRPTRRVTNLPPQRSISMCLAEARSWIGKWNYGLMTDNCEHFVKEMLGHPVTSGQVIGAISGGICGMIFASLFSEEKPSIQKQTICAGVGIVAGLLLSRAATVAIHSKH